MGYRLPKLKNNLKWYPVLVDHYVPRRSIREIVPEAY